MNNTINILWWGFNKMNLDLLKTCLQLFSTKSVKRRQYTKNTESIA